MIVGLRLGTEPWSRATSLCRRWPVAAQCGAGGQLGALLLCWLSHRFHYFAALALLSCLLSVCSTHMNNQQKKSGWAFTRGPGGGGGSGGSHS